MKLIIFLFIFVAIAAAIPIPANEITVDDIEWEQFKTTHNKTYDNPAEEEKRRAIYLETKKTVYEHNKKYDAGEVSYQLGINQFADQTHKEFNEKVLHKKTPVPVDPLAN